MGRDDPERSRARLAHAQAAVVAAILDGRAPPPGFAADALDVARAAVGHKRLVLGRLRARSGRWGWFRRWLGARARRAVRGGAASE